MNYQAEIKKLFPNSWCEWTGLEYEVWIEYSHEAFEVMGGGNTEEAAWQDAWPEVQRWSLAVPGEL